ncbi:MAG: bifunctional nuclease family protein [Propioniciclava sp.]|uniref:bifunctional nuclease family protein n=1 Tax=Propioniciclava sp. TaxID=2038686 RepID=UPI0039E61422
MTMIALLFSEVRVSAVADTPVLLLREASGPRHLAVWITATGANAILSALEEPDPAHPAAHDLALEMLAAAGEVIDAVHITGVCDGVFDAQVVVAGKPIHARVSDAIAFALRCGAPIFASPELMQTAGIGRHAASADDAEDGDVSDEQLARFREFLDSINPEDFEGEGPQP